MSAITFATPSCAAPAHPYFARVQTNSPSYSHSNHFSRARRPRCSATVLPQVLSRHREHSPSSAEPSISTSSATTTTTPLEARLRSLGLHAAADLAFVAYASALAPPPDAWRLVLHVLEARGLPAETVALAADRLGLTRFLSLDPVQIGRVVDYLLDKLQLTPAKLARLVSRRPALLGNYSAVTQAVQFLSDAGMRPRDLQFVAMKWPGLLTIDVQNAHRVLQCLYSGDIGFREGRVRKFLRRAPFVLLYDVHADIMPAVDWLRAHVLDVKGAHLPEKIIRSCPQILGTKPQRLDLAQTFFRKEVCVGTAEFKMIVSTFPAILICSIEHQLRPSLRYLMYELNVSQQEIARVVHAFPAILALDVETEMRPNVIYLRDKGIFNVGRIVSRLPPILGYDLESDIMPKMQYLEQSLGLTAYDVHSFPAYFSYSLRDRIEPRTKFLQKLGKPISAAGLNLTLALTDRDYCERVAQVSLSQYIDFCNSLTASRANAQRHSAQHTAEAMHASPEDDIFALQEIPRKRARRRHYVSDAKIPWNELF